MFKPLVLYTCIYIFNICLIFENLDEGDVFLVISPPINDDHVAYFSMQCTQIKSRWVRPFVDGEFSYQVGDLFVTCHIFKKVRRQGDYIIYRYSIHEYISCQYNHLVVASRIDLVKIKVKRGEPKRWKMSVADHDRIMETCIPITHWSDDWKLYATFDTLT